MTKAEKAKDYLGRIRVLEIRMAKMEARAAELREMATAAGVSGYSGVRVMSSPSGDVMSEKVIHYVETEDRIWKLKLEQEKEKDRVLLEICGMDDARHIQILMGKYVEMKTLGKIADEMGYSYERIRHMHGDALVAFADRFLADDES